LQEKDEARSAAPTWKENAKIARSASPRENERSQSDRVFIEVFSLGGLL
jgi:hypothetical protein